MVRPRVDSTVTLHWMLLRDDVIREAYGFADEIPSRTSFSRVYTVELVRLQTNINPTEPDTVVGVDAGMRYLATVASPDGELIGRVENPRTLGRNLARLRRLGPVRSRCQPGSVRYRREDGGNLRTPQPESEPTIRCDSQADHEACQDPRCWSSTPC